MKPDRFLVFDIWSDYAHFRRGYTTTSPQTYPIPPKTTLSGLIACILGLDYDDYYGRASELFREDRFLLSVQILNPIKKVKINQNIINTKVGFYLWDAGEAPPRMPISYECIKNPKYRIFVWMRDESHFNKLHEYVSQHKSFYTPYLGLSEFIANFQYVCMLGAKMRETNGREVDIRGLVRMDTAEIKMEEGKHYIPLRIPVFMDENRVVRGFIDLVIEERGETIKITRGEYYELEGYGNIVVI